VHLRGDYIAVMCVSAALWGQSFTEDTASISGQVTWESGFTAGSLAVELVNSGQVLERAHLSADGSFQLGAVPPGEYEIRVAGGDESVIQQRFLSVRGRLEGVNFRLEPASGQRPVAGTVSVRELSNPAPSAARKEWERAAKAAQKGLSADAVQHLQKALAIFPAYMEAHNDLGVQFMRQSRYEQAAAEFEIAAQLDPHAVLPNANLALASFALQRCGDAEFAARRAMADDPSYEPARRALGLVTSGECRRARPSSP